MGLSSFNAMRARKRAMEQANAKSEPAPIEVKEVEESSPVVEESSISNETKVEERKKKTDAEKLKKYVKTEKRTFEIHHNKGIYDYDSGVYLYPLSKDMYGINRYPSDTWEMSFDIDCLELPYTTNWDTYQKCALILGMASGIMIQKVLLSS